MTPGSPPPPGDARHSPAHPGDAVWEQACRLRSVRALREARQQFVLQYVLGPDAGNGTRSAVRAGYAPTSASRTAVRLLDDAGVRAAVEDVRGLRAEEISEAGEYIRRHLRRIVEVGMNAGPARIRVGSIEDMPEELRQYCTVTQAGSALYVMFPGVKEVRAALDQLARMEGLYRQAETAGSGGTAELPEGDLTYEQAQRLLGEEMKR